MLKGLKALLLVLSVSITATKAQVSPVVDPVGSNSGLSADFTTEPCFGNPAYDLAVPTGVNRSGYVGANWPPLHARLLSPSGAWDGSQVHCKDKDGNDDDKKRPFWVGFDYAVPAGAPSANSGLKLFVQTTDGFYHATSLSLPTCLKRANCHSVDVYTYTSQESDYAPVIQPAADSVNKVATIFCGASAQNEILFFNPEIGGQLFDGELSLDSSTDRYFNYQLGHDNN